ncbi:Multidrug resistance protein Stp [Corynebacterium provencense]|uniref:Multidrug resistance protein Stp n=1 Tax=Corynebacterium provencense TaxID=1737425 RepID=A0A2Z3YYG2_9CORY|nr:MFS transporter [Corynebacterium provencense]AWT26353.1 Multidrug resistance protein Stp [Corynebacterium provencense]
MQSETETDVAGTTVIRGRGLFVILVGAALTMVDFFIVNVALTSIGSELHAAAHTMEWVVAGYGGAYSILLVLGGRLGDMWGRRRIAVTGLVGFTAMSALCGLAPTVGVLIAARVIQGICAALLLPQTLATIQAVTEGEQKGRAVGWYGAVGGLSAALGQVLGGVLASWDIAGLGWRSIFLVNVPIGILLLIGMAWVPESRAPRAPHVDGRGTVIFAIAMATFIAPLLLGSSQGWPWWVWVSFAVAVVSVPLFVRTERRVEASGGDALIPSRLLQLTGARRGLLVISALCVAFGGYAFAFSIVLQDGLGFSPLFSGLSLLPMALGAFGASLRSADLISRFGTGTVALGGAVQSVGLLLVLAVNLLWWPSLTPWHFVPGMLLVGIGNGLLLTTIYRVVLSGVPGNLAGAGSGVLNTTQQTSMSLGVAILGTVFSSVQVSHGDQTGFVIVTVIWAVVAAGVAICSALLPDPRPSDGASPSQDAVGTA